jgi:hypothetical protein
MTSFIDLEFRAEWNSCINEKLWARVALAQDGSFEILNWGDEYSNYGDYAPERIYIAIAEELGLE